jgi:hypothetical protein
VDALVSDILYLKRIEAHLHSEVTTLSPISQRQCGLEIRSGYHQIAENRLDPVRESVWVDGTTWVRNRTREKKGFGLLKVKQVHPIKRATAVGRSIPGGRVFGVPSSI